ASALRATSSHVGGTFSNGCPRLITDGSAVCGTFELGAPVEAEVLDVEMGLVGEAARLVWWLVSINTSAKAITTAPSNRYRARRGGCGGDGSGDGSASSHSTSLASRAMRPSSVRNAVMRPDEYAFWVSAGDVKYGVDGTRLDAGDQCACLFGRD